MLVRRAGAEVAGVAPVPRLEPTMTPALARLPRRAALASLLFVASLAPALAADPIETALLEARDAKVGVTLVVGGAEVALLVLEVRDGVVIGKSQQHDRIVVRLDRIDALKR